jgi:hypothetical protein
MTNDIVETPDVQKIAPLDIPMVNMQVETANKYKRAGLATITAGIEDILRSDPELAEQCFYNKPAGKDRDGNMKYVKGGSVRLAEIIASEYGNIMVQIDAEENATGVVALCRVYDAQKNFAIQAPVKRAYTSARDQARQNTYNAAVSIAYRNGIFKVVPKAMAEKLWKIAEGITSGSIPKAGAKRGRKTRDAKLSKMIDAFSELKVTPEMLAEYLMLEKIDDLAPEQYTELRGLYTALKNGDADIGSLFNVPPTTGGSKINERTEVLTPEESEDIDKLFG